MAYEYRPPKNGFGIDYAFHNYLRQNFHPIVARVAFLNYVFQDNNMTGEVKSAYIRDDLIVEEAESTDQEWVSRRYTKPMDAWNRLVELVTGMWMPASDIYVYLRDIVRFVLYHSDTFAYSQSGHDLNQRHNVKAQIADFEDRIDKMFSNLQLSPHDRYLQDHAAIINTLLGQGCPVLNDLQGFCNGVRHQELGNFANEYPDARTKFTVDHFVLDPFEERHKGISRSIDDLRDKFIDWPRNKFQSGFVDLHFVLFLYDVNKCFSDACQWDDLDHAQSGEELALKLTTAFAGANVDQILHGQKGYDYRVVDREIFEWMKTLESMLPSGGVQPSETSYRKKRKRSGDASFVDDYVSGLRFPEQPPPLSKEEKLFNRPKQRPRIETTEEQRKLEDDPEVSDPARRNWIIPVVVAVGVSVAAYGAWKGMKN